MPRDQGYPEEDWKRLLQKGQYIKRMSDVDPTGEFDEARKSPEEMERIRQYILESQRRRQEGLRIPMSRAPELERRATEFLAPDAIIKEGLPPAHGFGERGTLAGDMLKAFFEISKMAGPGRGWKAFREAKRRLINPKKRGREGGKIDPAEYDKWSDEVSKNVPDPRPEDLMGHTKPDKKFGFRDKDKLETLDQYIDFFKNIHRK